MKRPPKVAALSDDELVLLAAGITEEMQRRRRAEDSRRRLAGLSWQQVHLAAAVQARGVVRVACGARAPWGPTCFLPAGHGEDCSFAWGRKRLEQFVAFGPGGAS